MNLPGEVRIEVINRALASARLEIVRRKLGYGVEANGLGIGGAGCFHSAQVDRFQTCLPAGLPPQGTGAGGGW